MLPLISFSCVITAETENFGSLYRGSAFLLKLSSQNGTAFYEISWQGRNITAPTEISGSDDENPPATLLLIPVEYGKSGDFELSVRAEGCEEAKQVITVSEYSYERENLTVDPKYVTISQETLEQIRYEQGIISSVLSIISAERRWRIPLARPRNSPLRSPFGVLRVFNGEPRSRHSGLDFAGAVGSEVKAVENGTVTAAGDFYFGGKCVIIDHGLGLSSIYMHLSEIAASVGDEVERGAVIGKVGATGRVTGPHLHLGISVFGMVIDPLPLLEKGR
ncbi:MAG: M23 family metallopeptidase [Deferribacteraceae bacterium]|jgi:murein DD-endopeptidase MepM/ murein hydrolase activator NlpD|nr:M23 family metallopeptidase [Deferribacteraceae bacterium]